MKQTRRELQTTDRLGLKVAELVPEMTLLLGFSEDEKGGLVSHVQSGSKGALAVIQQGDLVKEINHTPVNTSKNHRREMGKVKSGDTVQILIKRAYVVFNAVKITN